MCITTTTSASPSRNPCSLCVLDAGPYNDRAREGAISDAHLDPAIYKSLCADHREEVDYEVGLESGCDPAYEYEDDDEPPYGHDLDGYMGWEADD